MLPADARHTLLLTALPTPLPAVPPQGTSPIYNLLPDILSNLSKEASLSKPQFQAIMQHVSGDGETGRGGCVAAVERPRLHLSSPGLLVSAWRVFAPASLLLPQLCIACSPASRVLPATTLMQSCFPSPTRSCWATSRRTSRATR